MLSAADLAGMRETVIAALPDTCTIRDDTLASDGAGGHTVGSTADRVVACRVAPRLATGTGQLKDAETDSAGRLVVQAPWLITLPFETVIHATSHVADQYGREFEVFSVLARRSEELGTTILCRLINEGEG
jgi:hypothetical protein